MNKKCTALLCFKYNQAVYKRLMIQLQSLKYIYLVVSYNVVLAIQFTIVDLCDL